MMILPMVLGLVVGICGSSGAFHLWLAWRQSETALRLTFALVCFCVVGIALANVLRYQAATVATYVSALKWQLACIYVVAIPLAWFIAAYTRVRPVWLLLTVNGLAVLAFAINFAAPSSLFFTQIAGLTAVALPWGERIPLPSGTIVSPWVWLVRALLLITHLYAYAACALQYRRGERWAALHLALGVSTVLLARWHDHLDLARGTPALSWVSTAS